LGVRLGVPSLFLALLCAAQAGPRELIGYDVITAAGKTAPQPAPGKPLSYLLLLGGYLQIGVTTGGETPPAKEEVIKETEAALGSQGYHPAVGQTRPDFLMVVHWGYMGSGTVNIDDVDVNLSDHQMVALVAGKSIEQYDILNPKRTNLLAEAHELRYFLIVSAYDFTAVEHHKKVLLWQARISTPITGTNLAAMIPDLAKSGAAIFGRPTPEPKTIWVPDVPEGKVKVGTPVPVDDSSKATRP
jgi:hypothetical protein